MSQSNWGTGKTQFFYELSPDKVLDAVESAGFFTTGRLLQLNSMENRVYEVELDLEDEQDASISKWESRRIVKFYRPGRWNYDQIKDEHIFLDDLSKEGLPVAKALPFEGGDTIKKIDELGMYCSIFPRIGGRSPDEMDHDQFESIGRLLARLHNVGEQRDAAHRLKLDTDVLGYQNLKYIVDEGLIPLDLKSRLTKAFEGILKLSEPVLSDLKTQRIHGDCHMGNVLNGSKGLFFVDFDDMLTGPVVQDIWLLTPGVDDKSRAFRESLIEGYQSLRDFNRSELKLVESLRSMRFVHFAAWIGKRIDDPYFKKTFTEYGSWAYWDELVRDLEAQLPLVKSSLEGDPSPY